MTKHIFLTESQAQILSEEISKNSVMQSLILCVPKDITFSVSESTNEIFPIIDDVRIDRKFITITYREKSIEDEPYFIVSIDINPRLRKYEIEAKMYIALALEGYNVICLGDEDNTIIDEIQNQLEEYDNLVCHHVVDKKGDFIGIAIKGK